MTANDQSCDRICGKRFSEGNDLASQRNWYKKGKSSASASEANFDNPYSPFSLPLSLERAPSLQVRSSSNLSVVFIFAVSKLTYNAVGNYSKKLVN
jgi:hypothetical protein